MAHSYVKYTGDGTDTTFSVPFSYLDRRHISVKVDGVSASFSWLSNSTIQLNAAPDANASVVIRRNTPNLVALVEFTDGSTLTESDLQLSNLQALFNNQETIDLANELAEELEDMILEEDAEDQALLDRVKVRLDRIQGQLTAINSRTQGASADAVEAISTANQAMLAATQAITVVTDTGSQVNLDKAAAELAATTASTKASEASAAATNALSSAAAADTSEANAAASATSAASSAALAAAAANFNPDDFYTKPQTDSLLSTTVFGQDQVQNLSTSLAEKASTTHTHTISDTSGLQSALDGKAAASHTHSIANVTNLQSALDAKLSLSGSNQTVSGIVTFASDVVLTKGGAVSYFNNGVTASNYFAHLSGGITKFRLWNGSAYVDIAKANDEGFSVYDGMQFSGSGAGLTGIPMTGVTSLTDTLANKVNTSRNIIAGDGLVGGGNLSAAVTISIGTCHQITKTSTNTPSDDGHSHSIDTEGVVGEGTAALNTGAVGTYGWLRHTSADQDLSQGTTYTGSFLRWAGIIGSTDGGTARVVWSGTAPSGSWKSLSNATPGASDYAIGLFVRIS